MGSKVCQYVIPLENLKILEFTLPSAKQQHYSYFQLQGDALNMLHVRPWPMCPCFVPSAYRGQHIPLVASQDLPATANLSSAVNLPSISKVTQTFSCNSAPLHFGFSPLCQFIFQGPYLVLTSGISSLHPKDSSIVCTAQRANARKSCKALILLLLSTVLCEFHDYFQVQ